MSDDANDSPAAGAGRLTSAAAAAPPWRAIVARYAKPDVRRGIIQLLNTGLRS